MNSRRPIRMWIDGKCFNLKHYERKSSKDLQKKALNSLGQMCGREVTNTAPTQGKEQQVETEINKCTFDIFKTENGKSSFSFQVPKFYYPKLYDYDGFSIHTLSRKTNTVITIPEKDKEGKMTIMGEDDESVTSALYEIHSFIGHIRNQNPALQFTSIPCLSGEIQENFDQFKKDILSWPEIQGMEESIFISPLKLHITINVFALLDDREKSEAVKCLQEYKDAVLGPLIEKTGPLKVRLSGINCMDKNLKQVNVLYANAEVYSKSTNDISLQTIVDNMSNYFFQKGLVQRYQEKVKLHVTLINTKYRKTRESPKRKWTKRISFDATKIMEKYKDFEFGDCDLDSMHLSIISTIGEDGFYKPLSVIKFGNS